MSLYDESRWSREYRSADGRRRRSESRFLDGTATVTLSELEAEWPRWNQHERLDFCNAFSRGHDASDCADILRFLMKNGDHIIWSTIANKVAMTLPQSETVPFLKLCWLNGTIGHCANYLQALALTKTPDALNVLRDCFSQIWNTDGLLADAVFCNRIAFDAIWCIVQMMELGENPQSLRSAYENLKVHPSERTREYAKKLLAEWFEPFFPTK